MPCRRVNRRGCWSGFPSFVHVVTDSKRFSAPLSMNAARDLAQTRWTAHEVIHIVPGDTAVTQFFAWHRAQNLGRKRLLDTLLAATYQKS
jgi:hypothetical protein